MSCGDAEVKQGDTTPPVWREIQSVASSDLEVELSFFGWSVSIDGDFVVVGEYLDGEANFEAGAVHIFERNLGGTANWGKLKKLTASDAVFLGWFGYSVAIHEDTLVIGAFRDDHAGTFSGSAYVFERNQGGPNNWGEVTKLIASDASSSDRFGGSVAISGDTIVVGAAAFGAEIEAGSAYVFERNFGGMNNWGEIKKLVSSDAAPEDFFGVSVSISSDTIAIGATGEDGDGDGTSLGSVYVFERDQGGPGNWGETKKLMASDAADHDYFGRSVSTHGDTIAAAAFGDDACPDDPECDSGSAYVFDRDQGGADNWGEVTKLTASDAAAGDHFGLPVSISGNTIVAGASHNDSAYVFERNQGETSSWGEVSRLTVSDVGTNYQFGWSVAIDENELVVGAIPSSSIFSGLAYIFSSQVFTDGFESGDTSAWSGSSLQVNVLDRRIVIDPSSFSE